MLDQSLAGGTIAGHDVHYARGQYDFMADFRKCKRSQRGEFGRLQDDGISGSQSGRDLPRQHEQRKVPRNDLSYNTASRVVWKFLPQKLGPAGVMIEMPRHQRNVEVTALANRFSVVHGFENGQAARVLLYLSRKGVEVTSPGVRSERLPTGKGGAGGFDRSVNVRGRSFCNTGKLFSGRRVSGVEVFPGRGRGPCAIDEVAEAAFVLVEPRQRLFRVLWRWTVLHSNELFSDAHLLLYILPSAAS